MNINALLLTPQNSGSVPHGLSGLKNALLGAFVDVCQNFIMFVVIVVFMVPEPNLNVVIHDTLSFTCFGTYPVF